MPGATSQAVAFLHGCKNANVPRAKVLATRRSRRSRSIEVSVAWLSLDCACFARSARDDKIDDAPLGMTRRDRLLRRD